MDYVSVKDFGAKGDMTQDDTPAIKAALAAFPNGQVRIHFPAGNYLVSDTIVVNADRTFLEGDGKQATSLNFKPAANTSGIVFLFQKADGKSGDLVQCGISRMGFVGLDTTSLQKTAIKMVAASEMIVQEIATFNWTSDTSATQPRAQPGSIGLMIWGHEMAHLSDLTLVADSPIYIQTNPNDANISIDHFNFNNLYLIASLANPCIYIDSGVIVSNVTFDGAQAWVRGSYGLYWKDASNQIGNSYNLSIKNVRWEGYTNANGYAIYVWPASVLQNLLIENLYTGSVDNNVNGIYLQNVHWASVRHFVYGGTQIGIRSAQVRDLSIASCFFAAGTQLLTEGTEGVAGSYYIGGNHYTVIPNSFLTTINPAPSSGINQFESRLLNAPSGSLTGIGGNQMFGTVAITDATSGVTALFVVTGTYNKVALLLDPYSLFSTTQGTSGRFNVYWSTANARYEIENLATANGQLYITLIGKGEH